MSSTRILDVAKAAGVSTATVSRALNSPEQVSEEMRSLVMAAVETTGYRMNRSARNLRKQQSGEVLILVPNLGSPVFSQIISGIEETFSNTDYNVLIADTRSRDPSRDLLAELLAETRADGIIILDGQVSARAGDWLRQNASQQLIVFACDWAEGLNIPVVRSNNRRGAASAIQYLHSLGHQKIAHITGAEDNIQTIARREGVLEERARLNLPLRPDWVIRGDFTLPSGYQAAEHILALGEKPTAVFCASDMMAFGLISRLSLAGVRVPEDISVMGFDDIELAEYYLPRLTTIRQNRRAMGETSAARVLAYLNGNTDELFHERIIDVELIVRDSCAPPAE